MVGLGKLAVLGLCGLALAAAGCTTSRVAEHFGEAQRENVARMIENPEAERAPAQPVLGLDPLTAEEVVGKYEREQGRSREPSQVPSILLSTGSDN